MFLFLQFIHLRRKQGQHPVIFVLSTQSNCNSAV